jgi:hypothetical protein
MEATTARRIAQTNPHTKSVLLRVDPSTLATLDAWVRELNAAARAANDPREWSRQDVMRAILARRLRERAPGDAP